MNWRHLIMVSYFVDRCSLWDGISPPVPHSPLSYQIPPKAVHFGLQYIRRTPDSCHPPIIYPSSAQSQQRNLGENGSRRKRTSR